MGRREIVSKFTRPYYTHLSDGNYYIVDPASRTYWRSRTFPIFEWLYLPYRSALLSPFSKPMWLWGFKRVPNVNALWAGKYP
jgi:hypothetical protein